MFTYDLGCELCIADLDCNGVLDFQDVGIMIDQVQESSLSVDFNEDGFINFLDISEFIIEFANGC